MTSPTEQVLNALETFFAEQEKETEAVQRSERLYRRRMGQALGFWLAALVILFLPAFLAWIKVQTPLSSMTWLTLSYTSLTISVIFAGRAFWQVGREQPEVWHLIRFPRQGMISRLKARMLAEKDVLNQLVAFDSATLSQVRVRLALANELQRERTETIFGLVTKVGILPGVFTGASALLLAWKGANPIIALLLGILFLGLCWTYHVSSNMLLAFTDLRGMLGLLDRAQVMQAEGIKVQQPAETSDASPVLASPL